MIITINNQKFIFPIAANVPAAKINESPGKNGKKTKPVSQKIIITIYLMKQNLKIFKLKRKKVLN